MPEVIVAVEDPATPEGSVISHSEVDTQVDLHNDEKASPRNQHMADDELILASPVLYGFSLSDKLWRESLIHAFMQTASTDCSYTSQI